VTDIPDDLVTRRVEHRVQGNGELDDPETGANVAAGAGTDLDQPLAHVRGNGAQLVAGERLEVRR